METETKIQDGEVQNRNGAAVAGTLDLSLQNLRPEIVAARPLLKVYRMYPDVIMPRYSTESAACFDFFSYLNGQQQEVMAYSSLNMESRLLIRQSNDGEKFIIIPARHRVLLPLGIILDISPGYSVRAHPRSGLSVKSGLSLANCSGTIDEDFTHELKATLHNISDASVTVHHGDRVCQGELVKDERAKLIEIHQAPTTKGNRLGGFGHTGR